MIDICGGQAIQHHQCFGKSISLIVSCTMDIMQIEGLAKQGNSLIRRMLDEPVEHAACNIGLTSGKSWRFHDWVLSNAAGGSLYLDDYREFSIGAIVTPDEPLRMQF